MHNSDKPDKRLKAQDLYFLNRESTSLNSSLRKDPNNISLGSTTDEVKTERTSKS